MRSFDEEILERVRAYRGSGPYEKALRKRKVRVEPMFAEAKEWHGMGRFRLRTLWRVNAEAMLVAAGQNIKRLLTFSGRGPRKLAQVEALRPPALIPYSVVGQLQRGHRVSERHSFPHVFFKRLRPSTTFMDRSVDFCIRATAAVTSPPQNQGGVVRRSTRGACSWAATRPPPPPACVPRCAGPQRATDPASPWPLPLAPTADQDEREHRAHAEALRTGPGSRVREKAQIQIPKRRYGRERRLQAARTDPDAVSASTPKGEGRCLPSPRMSR
jgi:Transposase DDE domain